MEFKLKSLRLLRRLLSHRTGTMSIYYSRTLAHNLTGTCFSLKNSVEEQIDIGFDIYKVDILNCMRLSGARA